MSGLDLHFTTEPIQGFRVWSIVQYAFHGGGSEPRLQSFSDSALWAPMERVEATCRGGSRMSGTINAPVHQAPLADCSCGVHAYRAYEDARKLARGDGALAIGVVSLWGRTVELERGFRAQYAYPAKLWVYNAGLAMAEDLQALYGVAAEVGTDELPPSINFTFSLNFKPLGPAFANFIRGITPPEPIQIAEPGDLKKLVEGDEPLGLVRTRLGWIPPEAADVVTEVRW